MKSRKGKPDTSADLDLRKRLNKKGLRHFTMVAGAGSGKTTSLVKALDYLSKKQGEQLRRQSQQIACITYTDVAVKEIYGDVGHDSLFHVSTIHSFLWSVIKPFQSDLHAWVLQRLTQKIDDSQDKIDKPRTRETTKEKERVNIEKYKNQIELLSEVKRFRYGTGSDYVNGVLGHSDILKIGPDLISKHSMLQNVISQRFPVIFVDESQDTKPDFVQALKDITLNTSSDFCLGFFGDPMQKIYLDGIGDISNETNWVTIPKPENFRCPIRILNVINSIRAEADGLQQTIGRTIEVDGIQTSVQGTARLFILPADQRTEGLEKVRTFISEQNEDPLWLSDGEDGDVRVLVIVHRIAASRLGFPDIYSALNDKSTESLTSGLIDGTAWAVRPFIQYLLPLTQAKKANDDFKVISLLRNYCQKLSPENIEENNLGYELSSLNENLVSLAEMLELNSKYLVGDVINFIQEHDITTIDDRFDIPLAQFLAREQVVKNSPENSVLRFLNCKASQLSGYQTYVEKQSPFATQQGIKGAEFERVLVIIDEEENTAKSFSYGKYFGTAQLSETDIKNKEEGKDTAVDRTRRLFYVCCSRAVKDLAVVIFTDDVESLRTALETRGFFDTDDIHLLDN
ncbi:MAG: DNA helicase-2/ATP-dependent DNA helicase PcrA [Candidatus Paceibacteria bacterium]|jgi:DNA helicase-2/ATP-dependent DNA helicase PcrA